MAVDKVRVADVAIDPRAGGSDAIYTYRVSPDTEVGEAFFIPIGGRSSLGYVVSVYDADAESLGFAIESLKSAQQKVDGIALPSQLVDLARFVAKEYLCPLPAALSPAAPPGIRDRIVSSWKLIGEEVGDAQLDLGNNYRIADWEKGLTSIQREVVRTMRDAGGVLHEGTAKKIAPAMLKALKLLRGKNLVEESLAIAPFSDRVKKGKLLRLTSDSARIEQFLKEEGRKKPAQALVLMKMGTAEAGAALAPGEIKAMAGVTDTTVKALVDAGLLEKMDDARVRIANPPQPNPFQQLAIDAIVESIHGGSYQPFLLFGVTGSGKTEVFLRAAAEALKQGRQVLYLVPEIALATQAIAQLRERFGRTVAVLHSDLSPGERLANWMAIRAGEAAVVLGARSALFAPLSNIGLIVMDEEHEASYKQETVPRYHAKRLALELARMHGCPVVLGSATPSIESFQEAEDESLTLLSIPERAASATLPTVTIDDLSVGFRAGKPAILSPDLEERLGHTLARGEQAILFLNRRAYAPFLMCRDCGHQLKCPNCAVSLSFHRRDERLRCHHCGYQRRPPDICEQCHGSRINPFGVGTEKVEESVAAIFPDARVARLDRDVARRKGALEEVLASFRSGDIDILVGTQMVAKGLDFPNVTLVGVIAADISLNLPDFRASERTFQLLSQVAGRAGRGSIPGQVVIQTFNPDHAALRAARTHNFLDFFEILRDERRAAGYPPFRRLVNIVFSGENRRSVIQLSTEVAESLKTLPVEVLGPVDCVMERLQNRWRRHILLKIEPDYDLAQISSRIRQSKGVQVLIDVDPFSLM